MPACERLLSPRLRAVATTVSCRRRPAGEVGFARTGQDLGQAPVHDLDLAKGPDHDVGRLDVTVDDAAGMRVRHGLANRLEDRQEAREIAERRTETSVRPAGGDPGEPGCVSAGSRSGSRVSAGSRFWRTRRLTRPRSPSSLASVSPLTSFMVKKGRWSDRIPSS